MCECDPLIRTPFCGAPGCEWPPQTKEECVVDFQKDDIVEAFGLRGKVIDPAPHQHSFPVRVQFEDGSIESFRADGKLSSNHKIPALKLIERPKKKVKKKAYTAVSGEILDGFYGRYRESIPVYLNREACELYVNNHFQNNSGNYQIVEFEIEVEE